MTIEPARIPVTAGRREVGLINWVIGRIAARGIQRPQFRLVNALAHNRSLLLSWVPYTLFLLYWGKLSRRDAELVILRVGYLRDSEYELQQHRRLASTRGLDAALQARIFEGPDADGLTERERVLITATDEFVMTRSMSDETWAALSSHLNRPKLVEFCLLAGQYDMLAATIATLRIPLDFPD